MRMLTYLAAAATFAVPCYWTYDLNQTVDHLRHNNVSVPFFAYYRYGVVTTSVVFNVTGADCEESLGQLMPAFEDFVSQMQHETGVAEVRLAWDGETIAVMPRSALERRWEASSAPHTLARDPLATALSCTTEGELVVDWSRYKPVGSALT